jgi:hypothetical protein
VPSGLEGRINDLGTLSVVQRRQVSRDIHEMLGHDDTDPAHAAHEMIVFDYKK